MAYFYQKLPVKTIVLVFWIVMCFESHSQKRILVKDRDGVTHSIGGECISICGKSEDSLAERRETYLEITPDFIIYYIVNRKAASTHPVTYVYDFDYYMPYYTRKISRKDVIHKKIEIKANSDWCNNHYLTTLYIGLKKDKYWRANHTHDNFRGQPLKSWRAKHGDRFEYVSFDSFTKAEEVMRMIKNK